MAPCFSSSYQPLLMARRRLISLSRMRVAACQSPRWCLNTDACALEPPYYSANRSLQKTTQARGIASIHEWILKSGSGMPLLISDGKINSQPMQPAARLLNANGQLLSLSESQSQPHFTPVCGRMWWDRLRTLEFFLRHRFNPKRAWDTPGVQVCCPCSRTWT